jgi:ribonuclease HII
MKIEKDLNRFIFDIDLATSHNVEWIVGVDEVGYGCFAGDIVVGAVAISVSEFLLQWEILTKSYPLLLKVKDSKKTSEKLREEISSFLIDKIANNLKFIYAIGSGTVNEINTLGVTSSHNLATSRAISSLFSQNKNVELSNLIILDGNKIDECLKSMNTITIVQADNKSFAVAAASIIAKVSRDNDMKELSKFHPSYNFESNKGYGTKDHRDAISKFGIINIHRLKYCKNFLK